MRYLLSFIFSISAALGFAQFEQIEHSTRLMTFNIKYDDPNDGEHAWAKRRDFVVEVIRYHRAEIIGVQDALYHQVKELEYYFPKFKRSGSSSNNGKMDGEFCSIFYDSTKYKLLDEGTFWLSETPDSVGSKGWDAALPRIASWVKLKDISRKQIFYVFNAHLDHQGAISRIESARLITSKISEYAKDAPAILMGDFNSFDTAAAYQHITYWDEKDRLEDCIKLPIYGHHGPTCTYIGFDAVFNSGNRIDFIFVKNKIQVLHHVIIDDNWDGFYPSDHLPVLVELIIG